MPIVLDESHAASFGAVVRLMPPDEPCRLLLIDAHCDANEPDDVEELRRGVRRVASERQRAERVREYRRSGRVQAYNWLVPLMPLPVERVYWLSPRAMEALNYLPLRLAGNWFGAADWNDLPRDADRPWVATIDLDAFADAKDPVEALRRTWLHVLSLPNLQLITVCASTPWQKSLRQAQLLFDEAVSLALRTHPADVFVGTDVDDAPDTSRRAAELGGVVPRVRVQPPPPPVLAIESREDGGLFVRPEETRDVDWVRWEPHAASANLYTPLTEGKSFSGGEAPSALLWVEKQRIATQDGQLAARRVPVGVSWWQAVTPGGVSAMTPVRRCEGSGLHAAMSALLGTPYMFGAGLVGEGGLPVAMGDWGNDCANFLASAARACGARVPCVSPLQIRDYLQPYEGGPFTDLVYHAGNHAAALWQDRPPLGQFGPEDLLIHHLGGLPETLTRAEFERRFPRRQYETFAWKKEPLLLAAVGDLSPASGGVAGTLPEADFVLANWEGSVDVGGDRPPARYPQLTPPGRAKELLRGVDCVSLANNHSRDGGPQGWAALCRELDEAGVRYVGAGRDPVLLEKKGVRLAIWGVEDAVPENMGEWRDKADHLVAMVHWGDEMRSQPTAEQRALARRLAAAGADIVLGSHPHEWQEPFNIGLTRVYPSLGNWRFPLAPGVPEFNERRCLLLPLGPRHRRGFERVEFAPSPPLRRGEDIPPNGPAKQDAGCPKAMGAQPADSASSSYAGGSSGDSSR